MRTSLHRAFVRSLLTLSAMAGSAIILPNPLLGQERAATPTLLKVLAGTVASCGGPSPGPPGPRPPRPHYLVVDYRFPHKLVGHFHSREPAERLRTRFGADFGLFGPFVNEAEPGSEKAATVVSVTITTRAPNGRTDTLRVNPDSVDALFLTAAAFKTFAVPYYAGIYGADYANRLWRQVAPHGISCHTKSRSCFPKPDSTIDILRVMDPVPTKR